MAVGMITNFNQQAAAQQAQINQLRLAQQLQLSMSAAPGGGGLDTPPCPEGITRGQLRNQWHDAMGPASAPTPRSYENYREAFGGSGYIQDFNSFAARDMVASAGMLISQTRAPGSEKCSDSLLSSGSTGMTPQTIKELQKFLMSQGLDVGQAGCDGKLGPDTHKALMKFIDVGQRSSAPYNPWQFKNCKPPVYC